MHVGKLIVAVGHGQCGHVHDVRAYDDDRPRRPAQLDSVNHDEDVNRVEQHLHEMDPADPDVFDPHLRRHGTGNQPVHHGYPHPVITAQGIAGAGHQNLHRRLAGVRT